MESNLKIKLIHAPRQGKFYFIVKRGEEVLYDSQTTRNQEGCNPGRAFSRFDAYMRAWIMKIRLEKRQ